MPVLDLTRLSIGDRVQHELLVRERVDRETKDGKPFSVLTLGNSSGTMETSPIWAEQLTWVEGAVKGTLVQVIGTVSTYREKRQVQLTSAARILPIESFRAEDFLPHTGQDAVRLWDFVDRERGRIRSDALRCALDVFFADDDFRLRFERTPGSTGGHHAQIGGLLLHVCEVARIAHSMAVTMRANSELVFVGSLLHDIGKVESYDISPSGFVHTQAGSLLGHVVLGTLMLDRRLRGLPEGVLSESQVLELQHFIQSHHGALEHGAAVQPMTVEAEILHWADQASAKANDMAESLEDNDAFASGGAVSDKRPWRVRRRVWRRPHAWE